MTRCNDGGIDAHPIVRAYFRSRLQKNPEVWRAANGLLYEYYSSLPKDHRPETLHEMEPLYRAIDHGCCAGRYQEVLDKVLIERLRRGDEHYSFFKGYLGQEMTALSRFFRHPWTELAGEADLDPLSQAWLLNEAGSVLRVTGSLPEAVAPILQSIRLFEEKHEFMRASRSTATLVNVYMLMGRLDEALHWATRGVHFVDLSESTRERIAKYSLLGRVYWTRGETVQAEEWVGRAGRLQENAEGKDKLDNGHYETLLCSLLAKEGKWEQIRRIMKSVLKWVPESNTRSQGLVLTTLGQALFMLAKLGLATGQEAREKLDSGVERIRETGRQDELPRVLLTRAGCLLSDGALEVARSDVDEAYEISRCLGMCLHEADAHLAYVRLHLSTRPKDTGAASDHLQTARKIITKTRYGRRSEELRELQSQLETSSLSKSAEAKCRDVECEDRPTHLASVSNVSDGCRRMWDVFLCHAGEDKLLIVDPLCHALKAAGISCWYDKAEIRWGDPVAEGVNDGLRLSRFVIVVLSPRSIDKFWPREEVFAARGTEASSGIVKVLPLVSGSEDERRRVFEALPFLAGKQYLIWTGDPAPIVQALKERLRYA